MDNKSLIAIANDVTRLEVMLIESNGELTPAIEEMLSVKETNLPEKVDGYANILDRLNQLEAYYKRQASVYTQAANTLANAQHGLKERLKIAMQTMEVSELEGFTTRFKLSTTAGSLVIEDPEMIPLKYKSEVVETVIDKAALKADLEKSEVPGAKIEPGYSLRKFVNTKITAKDK